MPSLAGGVIRDRGSVALRAAEGLTKSVKGLAEDANRHVIIWIHRSRETFMENLGVLGFVFGMLGVVAFIRLEKLTKELKAKGILDDDYKEE